MQDLLNCKVCTRLHEYIVNNKDGHEDCFNAPVPPFGDKDAQLVIVGLAPGLQGANRTGRPFTGDYAGVLLYDTLEKFAYTKGYYSPDGNDDLSLHNCIITNAVKCVPPENKPNAEEINTCLAKHFASEISEYRNVKIFLALGKIAHDTLLKFFNLTLANYKFSHGAVHELANGMIIVDSYHCSRYNTNTKRLTIPMFEDVFVTIADLL